MVNRIRQALILFRRRRTSEEQTGREPETREDADAGRSRRRRRRRAGRRRARLIWRQPRTAFDWLAYSNRNVSLRLLHRNQIHVDTTVVTADGFCDQVHWQVLEAMCPKLVTASSIIEWDHCRTTRNGSANHRKLVLPDHILGSMALLLIECAYGEPNLSLSSSNLEEFYELALAYEIEHALEICLDFAQTLLNVHNCIYLLQLSRRHNHQKLRRASYSMLRSNFKLILHVNRDFHHLTTNQLRQLLLDNQLKLNDEEEIAWLSIVRWHNRKLLTQGELSDLYNQMVSGHQDVQLIHWPAPLNQLQLAPAADETNTNRARPAGTIARLPLRLTLDFYSPANPIETSSQPPPAQSTVSNRKRKSCSPLREAAEKHFANRLEGRRERENPMQLYALIKCLRFLRFKNVAAFDVIRQSGFVRTNETLCQLVDQMQIAYKLRKGMLLTDIESQSVAPQHLRRIQDYGKSRRERLIGTVEKLIARVTQGHSQSTRRQNFQSRDSKLVDGSYTEPTLADMDSDLISRKSLERADRPRVPIAVGLLIGGWQDGCVSRTIWAYDFVADRWFKLNIKLPEPRAFHASCSSPTKGHIYIFGGTNGEAILNSVLKLNLASDVYISSGATNSRREMSSDRKSCNAARPRLVYKFKELRPMSERRCHLSGVFHSDGRLYALGGHNGAQRLRSGEWYDPNSNQWHPIAEMTIARADAAACSHDNKIFIAGGQISDQFIQSSVEFYKSSDNTWTFAAPLIIPRTSFCMTSFKGQLLAIGGSNGLFGGEEVVSVTRTVERYNPSAGVWSFCASMIAKRHAFGAMQIGNKLLVMGGHGGRHRLSSSESLRIGHFSDQSMGSLLALGRSMVQDRLQRFQRNTRLLTNTSGASMSHQENRRMSTEPTDSPRRQEAQQPSNRVMPTGVDEPAHSAEVSGQLLSSITRVFGAQSNFRNAMRWIPQSRLPERRSGFSVVTVQKLKNAKDFTYYGSLKQSKAKTPKWNLLAPDATSKKKSNVYTRPSFIKQPGPWQKFKIIKRRKLIKHLKIAVIVTVVILLM